MSILHQAGLVERRKQGKWHYYRLAGRGGSEIARDALRWTLKSLNAEKTIATDAQALCCIRDMDPKELTTCYSGK
jgi:arsenate reductase/ArsR family transcriptional regulator